MTGAAPEGNTPTGERVRYGLEPDLPVAEFRHVLAASGLGRIRPLDDLARLARMLAGSDFVVTARLTENGALVGVARAIGDGAWCCYLSDLAVCKSAQGLGVGRGLMAELRRRAGPEMGVFLASVPEAAGFYERQGMIRLPDGFRFPRER